MKCLLVRLVVMGSGHVEGKLTSGACACRLSFTFGPVDIGCGDSSMESKSFFKLRA
jgi:hypothetical protein